MRVKATRVRYRQARPDDVVTCARIFVRAATDLSRRHGVVTPPPRVRDMTPSLAHIQRTDPKGFHVAEASGRVVAFASTIRRGKTHFLSMFWALPSLQSQGIGRRLLTRAFQAPHPPASAIRCVYASLDLRAQALYLKFGMPARGMIYSLGGAPKRSPRPERAVALIPLGKPNEVSPEMLRVAARYDRTFRGSRRDDDIRFIMGLPGARFFLVRAGGVVRGYAIVNEKGRIGPACVTDETYTRGLAWALVEAARSMKAPSVSVLVPGLNAGALDVFFQAGLRASFLGVWMSAKPIGAMECYLLAGGMLL